MSLHLYVGGLYFMDSYVVSMLFVSVYLFHIPCPMPYVQYPILHHRCPYRIPYAQWSIPHAYAHIHTLFFIPHTPYPIPMPYAQYPIAICQYPMPYVLYPRLHSPRSYPVPNTLFPMPIPIPYTSYLMTP